MAELQFKDIVIFGGMLIALLIIWITQWIGMERLLLKFRQGDSNSNITRQKDDALQKIFQSPDDKKRRLLETRGIILHYVNEPKLRQFYNSQFRGDLILESVTTETTTERQASLDVGLPKVAEVGVDSKAHDRRVNNLKPNDEEIHSMFLKYQRANIENDTVTLGLENIRSENLNTKSDKFKQEFSVDVPETVLTKWIHEAATEVIRRLETAQRWVLFEGDFDIQHDGEHYICTHKHEINKYITDQSRHITISFTIPVRELAREIAHLYAKNSSVRISVYGYIVQYINSEKGIWDLQVVPLAVY